MKQILITGGAGFIGSHTADALINRGYKVRILDNLDSQVHSGIKGWPAYLNREIECRRGDIRMESDLLESLEGVDCIFHFASGTGVGQSMYNLENYVDVNIRGTALLLEVLVKNQKKIKHFVLSSSRAVYGEGPFRCLEHGLFYPIKRNEKDLEDGFFKVKCTVCRREAQSLPVNETNTTHPTSIYGWTKLAQEEILRQMGPQLQMPFTILRYFNVYGSRQSLRNPYTGIISNFTDQLNSGVRLQIYENGEPKRDFIHVSDVVTANLAVLENELAFGQIFNIGRGQEESIGQIAEKIKFLLQKDNRIEITNLYRRGDIYCCAADNLKARLNLNWDPKMNLSDGLNEFIKWSNGVHPFLESKINVEAEMKQFGILKRAI